MVKIRWVVCDDKKPPPPGSIHIGGRLYQKLQYREVRNDEADKFPVGTWTEWRDVPLEFDA